MPKLVKLETTAADTSSYLAADATIPGDSADVFLPLDTFLEAAEQFEKASVWLSSDQDVALLSKVLGRVNTVALKFDVFMDGRSFSQARLLRENLEFTGEIRAVGNFIQDQLFYMLRCGFTEFSVEDGADEDSMRISMKDFSESYQAACDISEPLFRRRA